MSSDETIEYGERYVGGGYMIRNSPPEIERLYPLAKWIELHQQIKGGKVYRRTIIVVKDWAEVPPGDDGSRA